MEKTLSPRSRMVRFLPLLFVLLAAAPAKAPPPTSSMPSRRAPDPEIGERLWTQSCQSCHGEIGKGDGAAASSVIGGVPDLSGRITDEALEALIQSVQDGKGRMPAFSQTIERPDTRRLLIYLRDRQGGKPLPSKAKRVEAEGEKGAKKGGEAGAAEGAEKPEGAGGAEGDEQEQR